MYCPNGMRECFVLKYDLLGMKHGGGALKYPEQLCATFKYDIIGPNSASSCKSGTLSFCGAGTHSYYYAISEGYCFYNSWGAQFASVTDNIYDVHYTYRGKPVTGAAPVGLSADIYLP